MHQEVQKILINIKKMPKGWLDAFYHYATYKGRTNRLGFWSFAILNAFILLTLFIIDELLALIYRIYIYRFYIDIHLLFTIYALISIVPSICLCIRRLHDLNLRGWWLILLIVPFPYMYINYIFQLILLIAVNYPSDEYNRFGHKPEKDFTI
ncbi:DUF805 domain-containing protein [Commensalibacter oyaizuii]|uniref:DUF805 domain-containing protein n=1 Tax=Commensalibacter oyaizuii TaxID=3043873 RepID=A0ABT6Q069_9PROT|nr:DUF805 domain-containing protein [Commensalibacter sp. TBRC 16381]MDI2090474.1 DUF805 domain-containing protein [Commensalibacter sp. TBRC 16381]